MRAMYVALAVFACACGGRLADDQGIDPDPSAAADAATPPRFPTQTPDAKPPPPPPPPPPSGCSDMTLEIQAAQDGCFVSQIWSCDTDAYEFRCDCPSGNCECYKNGHQEKTMAFEGCPACNEPGDLIQQCPFPM